MKFVQKPRPFTIVINPCGLNFDPGNPVTVRVRVRVNKTSKNKDIFTIWSTGLGAFFFIPSV